MLHWCFFSYMSINLQQKSFSSGQTRSRSVEQPTDVDEDIPDEKHATASAKAQAPTAAPAAQ